jgi:hypothetical protein
MKLLYLKRVNVRGSRILLPESDESAAVNTITRVGDEITAVSTSQKL